MGDVCNVVEHDGTCNYQESGWWYFCCFSAILCDKGLKPAPKYSSRMEQNNTYIYIYGNLLFFLRRSSSISISMSIYWRCGHDIYIHLLSCLQRPNATPPIGDGSLLNPSPNNQFLAKWPRGESIGAAIMVSFLYRAFLGPPGPAGFSKPLRMETNKPTPRARRNSVFPSHQSVGSLRRSAGMG